MSAHDKPAFPVDLTSKTGLTKREYYACAAMQGLIATGWDETKHAVHMAKSAVKFADALAAALAPAQPVNDNDNDNESGGKQ